MNLFAQWYRTSLLLLSIVIASTSAASETITLKNKTEISYAMALNEAIDRLSGKVMNCIENNNGKTEGCICIDECSCKFKDEYILAKEAYLKAIKKYRHWEGNVVFYQTGTDPMGYNINLEGLERQFSISCKK